ncbi:hypothetical protein [Sulfurisphaera ohwakuensis]|uniref:Uncharacterized protein n=1 Tax=Sulfurisphaera ohwakuensis TaxID=69656 RepID=A0A7J9RP86_SULOH|nr:hypothetical protein [Sulfurisphaera ohwakuensis]MBB5252631.1 hypothetical protein [Sulfurisphaera ohwakuensis]
MDTLSRIFIEGAVKHLKNIPLQGKISKIIANRLGIDPSILELNWVKIGIKLKRI